MQKGYMKRTNRKQPHLQHVGNLPRASITDVVFAQVDGRHGRVALSVKRAGVIRNVFNLDEGTGGLCRWGGKSKR